jgi:hypothetical protein
MVIKDIQHPNDKKSSKPRPLQDTFSDLLSNIQKPILQCFFVVEKCTANAVSVAIGDNGNRLIFEI